MTLSEYVGAMRRIVLSLGLSAALTPAALAWGFTGHELVNAAAMQRPAPGLPAFLLTSTAVGDIVALGPELDRSKGSGKPHDPDLDPGHYVDLDDAGKVAGTVDLSAMPATRRDYDSALRIVHTDQYTMGFLPYAIVDGWEQLRTDFAIWRIDSYGEQHAALAEDRTAFGADRFRREAITIHDLGIWSHYVGDGSQPLHITIHFNGWGNYPNPNGYTTNHIHSYFESEFVTKYAKAAAVAAKIPAYTPANPTQLLTQTQIASIVGTYLSDTAKAVGPLYTLYASGDFTNGSPKAIDFTDAQLARGATEFRDLIALAWEDSLNAGVGYPQIPVRDIVSGKVVPTAANQTP